MVKCTLLALVYLFGGSDATYAKTTLVRAPHAHKAGCTSGHYGVCEVTIPRFENLEVKRTNWGAPAVFHSHGLIQVQKPPRISVAPREIATNFAVKTAKRGKVVERTEPTYFCKKPGFVLEGVDCVETLFAEPKLVCPGGFEAYGPEGCVRRAAFLQTCPTGYVKKNDSCAKLITQAFLEICPEGTIEGESSVAGRRVCQRQLQHPLTPTCPDGTYDGNTGNCIVTAFEDAKAYCPEGFTYDDAQGVCLQEEIYDCSHQAVALESVPQLGTTHITPVHHHQLHKFHHRKGRSLTHHHHHTHPLLLHGHHQVNDFKVATVPALATVEQVTPCAQIETIQPCQIQPCIQQRTLPPCDQPKVMVQPTKTTISVQKTCTRVTTTALVFDCDEGVLQGQRCLVKQPVPPVPVCRAEGNVDFCYTLQRTPPLKECPEGFVKECLTGRLCECVALEAAAFISSCPSGYNSGVDGCERTAQAQTICPPGYALQGDTCARVLREPADCVFSVTYECDRSSSGECI